jgi:glutathione reductase (NADPH)
LMEFKRSMIAGIPKNREEGFLKSGIAAIHGRARFVGPTSVQVGEDVLEAANVRCSCRVQTCRFEDSGR